MSLYESTFIIRHDMSTQQVEQLASTYTEIIKNNGGEVTKTEHWGLKTLAYRIKKNRKGHYVFFNVDAPSAAMQELERNLRLNEDVLRYLTVRVDELDPEPSPMMQARASRDERSRRSVRPRDDAASDGAASGGEQTGDAESKAGEAAAETAEETAKEVVKETAADTPPAESSSDQSGDQT